MEYELKLSQQQVQIILQALGELPLKFSLNAFAAVQEQMTKQDEAAAVKLEDR